MEIIVAMPFDLFRGDPCIIDQGAYELRHTPGQGGTWIGDTQSEGIAQPDLHRHPTLLGQAHELLGHGDHESIDVSPRDVLKVAARLHPLGQGLIDNPEGVNQGRPPVLAQLQKEVVVRYRGEDPRLFEPHLPHELKITLIRPDPTRDLRVPIPLFETLVNGLFVLIAVEEELRLAYDAVRASELMKQIIEINYLLCRIGGPRLLAIAKGGISNKYLFRGIYQLNFVVELNATYLFVREDITKQMGLIYILELKH